MATIELQPLPPKEAVDYFRRKGHQVGFAWQDVWQEEHGKAFTVAKAMELDVLEDLRGAVDRAIADGTTLAQFRRELEPVLQAKGWWGRKRMGDPLTGEEKEVQLGSPRRLRTIYQTNLRTSYATGRWEQIQRTKARRPYLGYVAILDERTRPQHRAWHGVVLPVDDEFWQTHYPPNGWECRCTVRQYSDRDLDRYGLRVTDRPPMPTVEYVNPRTGEVQRVPVGIDPGWGYNVGRGAEAGARHYCERLAKAAPDLGAASWAAAREEVLPPLQRGFARWVDTLTRAAARTRPTGAVWPVGGLSPRTVAFLETRGRTPESAAIHIADRDVLHMVRDAKRAAGKALSLDLVRQLPELIAEPLAVLWDTQNPALLYVFDAPGETRLGKVAVRVNYETRVRPAGGEKKITVRTNQVRTAGLVSEITLQDRGAYEIVEGAL